MENLNKQQEEAVLHKDGPLIIVAGAGSGKTKTLTNRLAHLLHDGVPASQILAITFTNKAAHEMKERVTRLIGTKGEDSMPFVGTFHSFGARVLRKEAHHYGRTHQFIIFDSDDSKKLAQRIIKKIPEFKETWGASKLLGEFSKYKNTLNTPEVGSDEESQMLYSAFSTYESALFHNNAFDFDDLIEKVVKLLKNNHEIRNLYANKFKYILVDEYQDTNHSQYELIKLLAEAHHNLCVVGDDNQAIYSFRYADFKNFLNFAKDWPRTKIVLLEENYRSTQNIIKAANSLIKHNELNKAQGLKKELWTGNIAGDLITVGEASHDRGEAEWIAEEISHIKRNQEEITAILYRTNAQSRAIEQVLIERNIPYEIFGGLTFYERKEIKDVLAGLRFAMNPNDSVSKERIEKTFVKAIRTDLVINLPSLKDRNTLDILGFFLEHSRYFEYLDNNFPNGEERKENITALLDFASLYPNSAECLEKISLLQVNEGEKNQRSRPQIQLMSIHMAKGLEFAHVFIAGCNEGILPHQLSFGKNEDLEEERRLMYVAMTRAKLKLSLSFYGYASRFLYEIPPELTLYKSIKDTFSSKSFYEKDDDEVYID
ncbi:MAG: hypothetical protein A3A04_01150 [Candidatus Harrisonbacteria bacterium RIFCSPLOWO2_01_FULL_40_28]|uniref:DNA 3'-5' helicase n=1 Tax=Candidatus Harrisonbacteria bacterium RIFCSPLOWO2_01_FULL_40_28 TaxID=1798406 RepID=A0A1G1ZL95_9BACT|nr:MAG: hypothetical protein A3A04_01150 [Candidatus Harrisonbacteria bacterium RIFCSPLOWO2_01_FULL_40_28]